MGPGSVIPAQAPSVHCEPIWLIRSLVVASVDFHICWNPIHMAAPRKAMISTAIAAEITPSPGPRAVAHAG